LKGTRSFCQHEPRAAISSREAEAKETGLGPKSRRRGRTLHPAAEKRAYTRCIHGKMGREGEGGQGRPAEDEKAAMQHGEERNHAKGGRSQTGARGGEGPKLERGNDLFHTKEIGGIRYLQGGGPPPHQGGKAEET